MMPSQNPSAFTNCQAKATPTVATGSPAYFLVEMETIPLTKQAAIEI